MENQHDVFRRADERMRQTLHELTSTRELVPQCPHPKNGRLYMDAHEHQWAMCAACAQLNDEQAAMRYPCDVCGTPFRRTPELGAYHQVQVPLGLYPALGDYTGALLVTVLTVCDFPECAAMGRAYEPGGEAA